MNVGELLERKAEENQTRKIISFLSKIAEQSEDEDEKNIIPRIIGKIEEKYLKD